MNKLALLSTGFAAWLALQLPIAPAAAQETSDPVFVASTGLDTNKIEQCGPTKPCATFNTALSVLTPGGTLICLDTVFIAQTTNITQDATIDCSHTFSAIFGVGAAAVTISSGAKVTLRGLRLYSNESFNGTFGIQVTQSATVTVDNCKIYGMRGSPGIGISVQGSGQVTIHDTAIEGNGGVGVELQPVAGDLKVKIHDSSITGNAGGVLVKPSSGATVEATIERTHLDNNNGGGMRVDGTNGGTSTVSVADSSSSLNVGNGVLALSGPGNATVNVTRTTIASNVASGVQSNQTMGGSAFLTVRGSALTNNASGNVNVFGGATLLTFGDNNVVGAFGTGFSGAMSQF